MQIKDIPGFLKYKATGEANPASKYTRGQALYILRNPTMPRRELMERLDCSLTFVKSVRSGKTWSHLNEEI